MSLQGLRLVTPFLLLPSVLLYAAARPPVHVRKAHSAAQTAVSGADSVAQAGFQHTVRPLVMKYCAGCHSGDHPAGGLSLAAFRDVAQVVKARDEWDKVATNLDSQHMPPTGAAQPTEAERDTLVGWVQSTLSKAECKLADPGHVTLRRLNREEYNNTIRDLVGVDFRPADGFPNDDVGYGFDNIGDVLSLSPMLMEKYLSAAEKIAKTAIVTPEDGAKPVRFEAADLTHPAGSGPVRGQIGWRLTAAGELTTDYTFPRDGQYVLRVNAYERHVGPDPAKMAIRLDGKDLQVVDVPALAKSPDNYEIKTKVTAGPHHVAVAFTNPFSDAQEPDPRKKDRNLFVNYLEIVGEAGLPAQLPLSQRHILFVHPTTPGTEDACARQILGTFARRAYRRPVTTAEVDRLVGYFDRERKRGDSFEGGIRLAVEAVLVSPNFLFHVEPDAKPGASKAARLLNNYELASRLSYFLWSSMPDEELFTLAAKGKLQDPQVLAAQARRMLKDPKAQALADDFAGQWLQLRNLSNVAPDPARFPDFNDTLRTAMRTETVMFFNSIVHDDRSVLDFLNANYTYLNEPLAKHYGIAGVTGDQFRRVTLTGDERGGLLSQASILTVTSNPTRTSPVKRGKWVLEQLLGTPPPPPPPNVPQLEQTVLTGTLRQKMEEHRKNPICASCHANMDPIGFGLENYDAVGAWRTKDGDLPIDASGTLPGGRSFAGPAQLKAILMGKKTQFVHCLAQKLLTYALGRGLESYDRCSVDTIVTTAAQHDYRFTSLITAIVQSDPFRKRRGDGGKS